MTSLAERKPLTRREFSYYLLFAVLILFLILTAALSLLYALPRPNITMTRVPIGESSDFPSMERPYPVRVEETSLFIVRTETGWLALDRRTPISWSNNGCLFAWTEANGSFVVPCYGSKFTLNGRLLEGPATQDLNQYPITERSGELFVDLTTLIQGETAK